MKYKVFNIWRYPSGYPFLIALMLLAATSATLSLGDEKLARELAIYAYYFLAIGVIFQFIGQLTPETLFNIISGLTRLVMKLIKLSVRGMVDAARWLYLMISRLYRAVIEAKKRIKSREAIVIISDTSRNIAVFLSVFFLASLVYGLVIGWQHVERYLFNLFLMIIGLFAIHILIRRAG